MSASVAIIATIATIPFQAVGVEVDSHYCRKVTARANGDAAVLLSPSLFVQSLRYPQSMDLGQATNNNVQSRIGLSSSILDGYRGLKLMELGEDECLAFESRSHLTRVLLDGLAGLQVASRREQVKYLEANQENWRSLLEKAKKKLDIHVITVDEFDEFVRRMSGLEKKLEEAKGAVSIAEAKGVSSPKGLQTLQQAYLDKHLRLESTQSSIRRLQDWNLRIVGGVIPTSDHRVEWFGWVEASYNFGGIFQRSFENTYLKMRQAELENAPYEYPARLRALHREAQAAYDHSIRELALFEEHLAFLNRIASTLAVKESPATTEHRDLLFLERLTAMSEQTYLKALVSQLIAFLGKEQVGVRNDH